MLCSCLQIQCLKTAAPATLHYCQGCSGTAALIVPRGSGEHSQLGIALQPHCKHCAQPTRAPGAALGTELKHSAARLIYTGVSEQSFTVSCRLRWERQWAGHGSNPSTSALLTGQSSASENRGWLLQNQGGLFSFIHIWWFC